MPRARVLALHTTDEVYQALQELGVAPDGVRVMARKGVQRLVLLTDISAVIANIVKQEMLARGGDAAVPAGAYELRDGATQALLMGTLQQYRSLCRRFQRQGAVFARVAEQIQQALATHEARAQTITLGSIQLSLSRAHVIGILDMALFPNLNQALDSAFHLAEQGATIIEVRPPYLEDPIQMSTVAQWFEHAAPRTGLALGIGTSQPELARQAATAGAVLVTPPAGAIEPAWAEVAASAGAALLLRATNVLPPSSRAKSTPLPRQGMDALIGWFDQQIGTARSQGITDDHLLLDPGLGSAPLEGAQTALLHRLWELLSLGHPLALSLDDTDEGTQSLPPGVTAAVAGFAIAQGVTFLRGRSVSLLAEAAQAAAALALPFTH